MHHAKDEGYSNKQTGSVSFLSLGYVPMNTKQTLIADCKQVLLRKRANGFQCRWQVPGKTSPKGEEEPAMGIALEAHGTA